MAKEAWETVVAFKLVWVRVLGYFAVPAWLMWEALTKDVTGPMWETMHPFDRFKIIGAAVAAGVISFLAFLDQSMNRAKQELERRRAGNTQFLNRPDTGP